MRCEIRADGFVYIIAKTVTEAVALKSMARDKACDECGDSGMPVIVDYSVLSNKKDTGRKVKDDTDDEDDD